jgi:hypothetical protein
MSVFYNFTGKIALDIVKIHDIIYYKDSCIPSILVLSVGKGVSV